MYATRVQQRLRANLKIFKLKLLKLFIDLLSLCCVIVRALALEILINVM